MDDLACWFTELQFEDADADGNREPKPDQTAFEEARVLLLTGIRSAEASRLEWSWVQPALRVPYPSLPGAAALLDQGPAVAHGGPA